MHFFFVDDARQNSPSRPGMGPLIAIGGFHLLGSEIKNLNKEIDLICSNYGFPSNEPFKWSPGRDLWMHDNLIGEKRKNFYIEVLTAAQNRNIGAIVVIEDTTKNTATGALNPEVDVIKLFFERVDWRLQKVKSEGIIIIATPGGDRRDEFRFLYNCLETLKIGTSYMNFEQIILNPLCAPSKLTRLLQLADLITSCTLSIISGENECSPPIFQRIKNIMCKDAGRIGGVGLKIHPDYLYVNLYHWIAQDSHYYRGNSGYPLPFETRPYDTDPCVV